MNRENWLKNIEGAVFDLDGTLLDSSLLLMPFSFILT